MDAFIEGLFDQKLFLIIYGLLFYYLVVWSMARNGKKNLRNARLKLCDSKAERAMVYADEKYEFHFKHWAHDQKDEFIVALAASVLIIEFDDVVIEVINNQLEKPITAGNWVYLCGGVVGDLVARLVIKLRS